MGDTCCTKFETEYPRKAELDCSLLQFIRGPHQAVAGTCADFVALYAATRSCGKLFRLPNSATK
jgi:hypothetical protein